MRRASPRIRACAVIVLFLTATAGAARKPPAVRLAWTPASPLSELGYLELDGVGGRTLELRPFEDERARTDRIGEIRDDEPRVYPVATEDDVARWVTEGVGDLFDRVGLRRVGREGDVVVTGAVRNALVTERGGLEAEISLWVVARTPAGEKLWEGLVLGAHEGANRFDRDRAYSEALSNALVAAVVRLLENSSFTETLGTPEPEEP